MCLCGACVENGRRLLLIGLGAGYFISGWVFLYFLFILFFSSYFLFFYFFRCFTNFEGREFVVPLGGWRAKHGRARATMACVLRAPSVSGHPHPAVLDFLADALRTASLVLAVLLRFSSISYQPFAARHERPRFRWMARAQMWKCQTSYYRHSVFRLLQPAGLPHLFFFCLISSSLHPCNLIWLG